MLGVERGLDRTPVDLQQQVALAQPGGPARRFGVDFERQRAFAGLQPLHAEHRHGGLDPVEERHEPERQQRQRPKNDQRLARAEPDACHGGA